MALRDGFVNIARNAAAGAASRLPGAASFGTKPRPWAAGGRTRCQQHGCRRPLGADPRYRNHRPVACHRQNHRTRHAAGAGGAGAGVHYPGDLPADGAQL